MQQKAPRSKTRAWVEAMRLRTLPVSVAGVFAGWGCAAFYDSFRPLPALICLLFAITAQISSNFANEYYDYANGLDKKGREGFRRGVTEGDLSPRAMKHATYTLLLFDCLLGCSLIIWGGLWLVPVGILIAIFAVCYSTGPYPLSHHGLGDLAVIIFFGFVPVAFTTYVQTQIWDWHSIAIPISLAIGLLGANVLIVNNYRDMDDDLAVGKKTTVVIFGRKAMGTVYLLNGILALALIAWALSPYRSAIWLMAEAILLAMLLFLHHLLITRRGSALNPVLGQTAMFLLLTSAGLLITLV